MAKSVEIREIANGFIIRTTIETELPDGGLDFQTTEEFSPINPMEERRAQILEKPIIPSDTPASVARRAQIING